MSEIVHEIERPRPRNTGAEEQAMRAALVPWIKDRWGDDVRVIHELALGRRRIDMVVVGVHDVAGIELKGPRDRLDDRLERQLETFGYYMPELWLAVAPRWRDHNSYRYCGVNRLVVLPDGPLEEPRRRRARERFKALGRGSQDADPKRDDLACARLLELLWVGEVLAIAQRTDVLPSSSRPGRTVSRLGPDRVRGLLARMLTGHEIVKQVCLELRSRPLTGLGSDKPLTARPR